MTTTSKGGLMAAILTMSLLQMGATAITPILGPIAQAFPRASSTDVQFLMTSPSLAVIVFGLLSPVCLHKLGPRTTAALGCALFIASGMLSWLFHDSLPLLYVWGMIMGAGIGLTSPAAMSLVGQCFEGNERARLMGWQSSAANIGGMLMSFLGGFLALIHWSFNYLVYLILIPGLVLTLIFVPKHQGAGNTEQQASTGKSDKPWLALCILVSITVMVLFNIAPTNLSIFVQENGMGDSAQAGIASTVLLLFGTLAGLAFGKIASKLGHYVIVLGFVLLGSGQILIGTASSYAMVLVGCALSGATMSMVMPQVTLDLGISSGDASKAGAYTIIFTNIGGFLSPLITNFAAQFGPGVGLRFVCSSILALVVAVIAVFVIRSLNKTRA